MSVLGAFVFPPIDELFRWKDIAFNDTAIAINKTAILMLASAFLIVVIYVGGSRRMKMVPSGHAERAGDDLRVRRRRHHA